MNRACGQEDRMNVEVMCKNALVGESIYNPQGETAYTYSVEDNKRIDYTQW